MSGWRQGKTDRVSPAVREMIGASLSAAPVLVADAETGRLCRRRDCGHTRFSHQHYRDRDECSACPCPGYRAPLVPPAAWLTGIFRRRR